MEFHYVVLLFVTSLTLTIITSAILPQELYWQSMLPTTPMPNALRHLLPSGQKSSTKDTSKQANGMSFKDNAMVIDIGGIDIDIGDGVSVDVPAILGSLNPFSYKYGPSKYELRHNKNTTLFFLSKDLHPGTYMNLNLVRISVEGKFLPRRVADMIPFSSTNFSQILHKFSIKPNSTMSKIMKKTIKECEEEPTLEGEEKYCATSLEGMVDFITSKLGKKNIQALSTDRIEQQRFSIKQDVRMVGVKMVACHPEIYAYPVFYCHKMHNAKAYVVPLVGTDGMKVKAVVVCHADTSKWNPRHLAFQVLKVKPGTVPICHFLTANHILFVAD
ncbi:BURP domain protein RD22-like [Euphorbia lathyris]|uniref:BURP domain protein RD22-like n=1 Tax=Euphorbia lathyris TaxID=212925 RepID=UPI003313A1B3